MHSIAGIFFIVIGFGAIAAAIGHEIWWARRRAWSPSTGVVKSYKARYWADGGPTYPAIIEFEVDGVPRPFDWEFDSEPRIGDEVSIVVSPSKNDAAEISSRPYRLVLSLALCGFGLLFILVGANIKPIGEQAGTGQPATRSQSDSQGGYNPQPVSEGRSR
jgi:hypothetical protein